MISTTQPESYQAYNPLTKEERAQSAINRLDKGTGKASLKSGKLNFLLDIDTNKTYKIKVGRFSAELKASSNLRLPNESNKSAGAHIIDLSTLDTKTIKSDEDLAKALKGRIVGFSVEEGSGRAEGGKTTTRDKGTNLKKLGDLSSKSVDATLTHTRNKADREAAQKLFNQANATFERALKTGNADTISAAKVKVNDAFKKLQSEKEKTSASRKTKNAAKDALSNERKIQRKEDFHAAVDSMRTRNKNLKKYLNNIKADKSAKFSNLKKLVGSTIKSMTASSKSSAQNFVAGTARRGQTLLNGIQILSEKAVLGVGSIVSRISDNLPRQKPNLEQKLLSRITVLEHQVAQLPPRIASPVYRSEIV